ncbi:MAG: hypothetical protein FWD93_06465, partial [Coriobacteriia bacterium]|nr:hypothetical protein [Coriobacteriia bacterium]
RVRDDRLMIALAEQLEGEPLPEMVESRTESMIEEFGNMLEQQSDMTVDAYLEQGDIDPEQFQADMEEQASISLCNDLALEALVRMKNLDVGDDEIDAEFETAAKAEAATDEKSKVTAHSLRERWEKSGMMTRLRDDLARRKAMKWLRDNAIITIEEELDGDEADTGTDTDAAKKAEKKKKDD